MVKTFFGLRLDTTAMLTGWIGTIGSLVSVVFFGICLGFVDEINKKLQEIHSDDDAFDPEDSRSMLVIGFIAYVVLNSINLAASFALLLGTYKERHLLLMPWLTNSAFALVINFVSYLMMVLQSMQISYSAGYFSMLFGAIGLALYTYIWLAIYSHYKILQCQRDERQALRPNTYPVYVKN